MTSDPLHGRPRRPAPPLTVADDWDPVSGWDDDPPPRKAPTAGPPAPQAAPSVAGPPALHAAPATGLSASQGPPAGAGLSAPQAPPAGAAVIPPPARRRAALLALFGPDGGPLDGDGPMPGPPVGARPAPGPTDGVRPAPRPPAPGSPTAPGPRSTSAPLAAGAPAAAGASPWPRRRSLRPGTVGSGAWRSGRPTTSGAGRPGRPTTWAGRPRRRGRAAGVLTAALLLAAGLLAAGLLAAAGLPAPALHRHPQAATGDPPPSPTSGSAIRGDGYAFELPRGWRDVTATLTGRLSGHPERVLLGRRSAGYASSIVVNRQAGGAAMPPAALAAQVATHLRAGPLHATAIGPPGRLALGDVHAVAYDYRFADHGRAKRGRQLVAVHGGVLWLVTFTADARTFPGESAALGRLLGTWSWASAG